MTAVANLARSKPQEYPIQPAQEHSTKAIAEAVRAVLPDYLVAEIERQKE